MSVALDDRLDDVRAEIGRVHLAEPAAPLADRGADGVDDVGLGHGVLLVSRCGYRIARATRSRCQAASPQVGTSAQARFIQRCRSYSNE